MVQGRPPPVVLNQRGRGVYILENYKDMSYDELYAVYLELTEELAFVMLMMKLRKDIDAGREASAQIQTEKLIERCRESND